MQDTEVKPEKFLKNLKAEATYKNIKAGFEWQDIPKFAVITGENGSGKTALLQQISYLDTPLYAKEYSIFTNKIMSKILYFSSITLTNKSYNYNDSTRRSLENIFQAILDFKQESNIFNMLNNYLKQYTNETITFKDFIQKNYQNFNVQERNVIENYRRSLDKSFASFEIFFKRNNITIEDILLKMNKDDIHRWLDSLNDINLDSKPTIFDEQLLVNTFGNYFIKFENYKRELEKQYPNKQVNEIYRLVEAKVGKNPLKKINDILQKYYDKYEIDVTRNIASTIQLICRDTRSGEQILLNELSLGEQIIISLVLWQYGNTSLDSIILLLDEPDSHLNPKMANMLIDILKNIVVKSFGCQVIMTTHSLSSVAYCDEEELFFMREGTISKIEKKDAIEKLSNGIMTFNSTMCIIEQIQESTKNILLVEGKLDELHIKNFYNLKEQKIPFEIIICNSVDNMKHFAIVFKQLKIFVKKILFLCDYDKQGIKVYDEIQKQGYQAIYTLDKDSLSEKDDRVRLKNYPIEMLYPLEILRKYDLVEELELSDYINGLDSNSQTQKAKEFSNIQDKEKYRLKASNDKKSYFTKEVIKTLDVDKDLKEIENLIIRIEKKLT